MIEELIYKYSSQNISLYGLGTETERFLNENANKLSIVGLLDGFKSSGEIYGYPIIPLSETLAKGVKLIIVIARPGSCKAIAKRIGNFCRENDIALFDVRGRDLLDTAAVTFDFKNVSGASREDLIKMASDAEVISFDLFDTLVMRKTKSYTDVFDLLDIKLRDEGISIPDFAKHRLFSEKELSKDKPPRLEQIYDHVLKSSGGCFFSAEELARREWELDFSLLVVREAVREMFGSFASMGKKVVITTDTYYSKDQIIQILDRNGISGYEDILVSCEYGTAKTQELFSVLSDKYIGKRILHIGDDEFADIEKAKSHGIDAFRIYSAIDLFDALGGLGAEEEIISLSDRVKMGLFQARIFNDPFWFEDEDQRLSVKDASDIGYLFCGPMISDFTLWMNDSIERQGYDQALFGARDGYLIEKLFQMLRTSTSHYYFHTSRTAAIRAGMESQDDIDYVDSMKFFGSPEETLKVRFGIDVNDVNSIDRNSAILEKGKQQRKNYHKYIDKLGIGSGNLAFFDFVAKGTTQMYLQRLFSQHMKGFYFLQLEPEFMADKDLDIEAFYADEGKDSSAIFDNYYILETILTAPYPQMEEMDDEGNPIYVKETRSDRDLKVFDRAQRGIMEYFGDFLRILPESARKENKKLDEKLLALVNKVQILDEDFLALKVEDPFFGRMTDIKDVIG
ncbi:hypothetical protein SAMN05216349_13421 [Oribacterium sp. KHPX15]|uniref:hypothetical protein n=1 Tax=Oribacterium sp. KHPX15 TaxID=1855342 RepID=UPI0008982EDE|nr:hypothetical protein [Oribacterium sp. KHPX15]SEA83601.1 hypothetical protein SAMN05216349_13421 [Oribacterium sp. KHPX15]